MWLLLGSVLINEVGDEWGLSETEAGSIVTVLMLGFLIGAYGWGYCSDRYGRMFSFRKTLLLAAVAAVGAAASVNFPMLLVFCLFAGAGIGGDVPVDGTVFCEFCPTTKRWLLTAMSAVCALGAVIVPLFAFIFIVAGVPHMWRYVTGVTALLNFAFWLARFYVLETPKFLVVTGRLDEAAEVLRKVAAINGKQIDEVDFHEEVTLDASVIQPYATIQDTENGSYLETGSIDKGSLTAS
jgi:MFS family permease